ncbi:MAG TPA: glycosyltransferase [Dongiaceae bacterium]|nr:glycosyltransferase [Dongiaceae bacterium]
MNAAAPAASLRSAPDAGPAPRPPAVAPAMPPAPPIRVLHLISTLRPGGTELAMIRLLGHLDRESFRCRVAWLRDDPVLAAAVQEATGHPPIPIGLRGKVSPAALVRLAALVRRERFDIVHTHMDLADYYGAAAARLRSGTVLVSSKQNADEFRTRRTWKRPPFLLLEHCAYGAANAVIAVSEGLVDFLERAEGLPRHKTVVIGNGVDPDLGAGAPDRAEARRRLGLPATGPILGTVGRLAAQKGQVDLLRALPSIRARFPEALLVVAGDGPERAALEREAERLGVTGAVRLLGHQADVPAVLAALDLFLLPSLWEGLPLALLEAMAMRLPVVATRAVGIDELITDGVEGRLTPLHDPAALAAAAIDLLADPQRAQAMGTAARRRAVGRHSQAAVAADVAALYRRLLQERA